MEQDCRIAKPQPDGLLQVPGGTRLVTGLDKGETRLIVHNRLTRLSPQRFLEMTGRLLKTLLLEPHFTEFRVQSRSERPRLSRSQAVERLLQLFDCRIEIAGATRFSRLLE
jgi:hypothetical protein